MRPRARQGFTLIELLVVIALLAVASAIGTAMLVKFWDLWGGIRLATQLDRTADNAIKIMRADFASAVNSATAGVALQGTKGTADDPRFFGFPLASDTFTLPVEIPAANGKATVLVGYQLEKQGEDWFLVRSMQPLRGGEATKQNVAEGVIQMRVEYAGAGGEWTDTWTQPVHPRAVRVGLTVASPGNPKRDQAARKAVFTVNVP